MLREVFEKVYLINLSRRKDRLDGFFSRLPEDWPFRMPVRYEAVDGGITPPPRWWRGVVGSWGCYRTHLRIIEECLNENIESVLILEDDAVCIDGFTNKVTEFWNHLPDDWNFVYLGGQHLEEKRRLPRKLNDWVYIPYNVNRTHCYGIRGRKTFEAIYRHLYDYTSWNVPHHIDHYLGVLHKETVNGLYVPREWLVEQDAGSSDICISVNERLRLHGAEALVCPKIDQKGIAILGDYFGGTNTVAGILYILGVNLGAEMQIPESQCEPSYSEDALLGELCRNSYSEPWLSEKIAYEDRANHMRRWAGIQCEKRPGNERFCGKHPILSFMGREILETWNDPIFIIVDRPSEDSVRSMGRVNWAWNPEVHRKANIRMAQAREDFVRSCRPEYCRISFDELTINPNMELTKLCSYLNVSPSVEEYRRVYEFIGRSSDDLCFIEP